MNRDESIIIINKDKCDSCGTCISVCPENAVSLVDKVTIDRGKCVKCLKCLNICPFAAVELTDAAREEGGV